MLYLLNLKARARTRDLRHSKQAVLTTVLAPPPPRPQAMDTHKHSYITHPVAAQSYKQSVPLGPRQVYLHL